MRAFALLAALALLAGLMGWVGTPPAVADSPAAAPTSGSAHPELTDEAAAAWSAEIGYDHGDRVTHDGSLWQAAWWTKGQPPGDPNGPWQEWLTTPDGTAIWTPSRSFNAGDVVLHRGLTYVAKWWTRNQLPTVPDGPWRAQLPSGTSGTPTDWSATHEYSSGALVRHAGHLWVALWWTSRHEPGALDGPWGQVATTTDGRTVWTPTRAFDTGDVVVWQGAGYVAKWWTRNHVPGAADGPWRATGATAPSGARAWSADAVFVAGDVAVHASRQYVATQANRDAEPGDPAGPWAEVPAGVRLLAPPTVAGKAKAGRTLKARAGRWDARGLSFEHRWFVGRAAVSERRALTVTSRMKGKKVRVVVTAIQSGAPVGSAASRAVRVRR